MGYGMGPGPKKPVKKPVHQGPSVAKPPVQEKPAAPQQQPYKPPFPFDMGKLFGDKWNFKK